jgi:hypothetical protein
MGHMHVCIRTLTTRPSIWASTEKLICSMHRQQSSYISRRSIVNLLALVVPVTLRTSIAAQALQCWFGATLWLQGRSNVEPQDEH